MNWHAVVLSVASAVVGMTAGVCTVLLKGRLAGRKLGRIQRISDTWPLPATFLGAGALVITTLQWSASSRGSWFVLVSVLALSLGYVNYALWPSDQQSKETDMTATEDRTRVWRQTVLSVVTFVAGAAVGGLVGALAVAAVRWPSELFTLSQPRATVIAAGIALVAAAIAFGGIVLTQHTSRATTKAQLRHQARALLREERRKRAEDEQNARREAIQAYVPKLARLTWQCVAAPRTMLNKIPGSEGAASWKARGSEAAEELRSLRLEVRHLLPGLEEPLRVLTRVPDWVVHKHSCNDLAAAKDICDDATQLRQLIDRCIVSVTVHGESPDRGDIAEAERRAEAIRQRYDDRSGEADDEGESEDDGGGAQPAAAV